MQKKCADAHFLFVFIETNMKTVLTLINFSLWFLRQIFSKKSTHCTELDQCFSISVPVNVMPVTMCCLHFLPFRVRSHNIKRLQICQNLPLALFFSCPLTSLEPVESEDG